MSKLKKRSSLSNISNVGKVSQRWELSANHLSHLLVD